jgi:polyhydroxyalkanoate synthesis regulator phasin
MSSSKKATSKKGEGVIPAESIEILRKLAKDEPLLIPVLAVVSKITSKFQVESYESLSCSLVYLNERLKFITDKNPFDSEIEEEEDYDEGDEGEETKSKSKKYVDPVEKALKAEKANIEIIKIISSSIPSIMSDLEAMRKTYMSDADIKLSEEEPRSRVERWASEVKKH